MKKILTLLLLLGMAATGRAQDAPEWEYQHQLRLGWGTFPFESFAFHETPGRTNMGFTGHCLLDYQIRVARRVSVGAQVDFQGIFWTEAKGRVRNYDISVMPTVNFIWMDTSWWRLYSGLATGVLFATDNARNLELAPVVNVNLFGMQVGKGHWSGFLEWDSMWSLTGVNNIYMLGTRKYSAGVVFRW